MRQHDLIAAFLLVMPALGCPSDGEETDDGASETSGTTSSTGASTTSTSSSTSGASTTTGDTDTETSDTDTAETGMPETESESETGEPANCIDATLWAGNPYFDGDFEGWDPAGHPLSADPPLRSRQLVALGDRVAINTQPEIWIADDVEAVRIAGDETDPNDRYEPSGPCADTRFIMIEGLAALPNGNVVVADVWGNGLVELSDPTGTCMAAPIAGNAMPVEFGGLQEAANAGDVDGPGVDARFNGVEMPLADADGNIYVHDLNNHKIKRVANDAARTVTTLAQLPDGLLPFAMTELDGTIYVVGSTGTYDFMMTVDATTPGEPNVLFQENGHFDEFDTSVQAVLSGISTDGTDLLVVSAKGYLWRVSTTGEPLATVAGVGDLVDFPELDLTQPVALDELPLNSYTLARQILSPRNGDFLFAGSDGGIGYHVWSINCG